jgi:hypothetical protein
MTGRETLIALIEDAYFCNIENLADHLIANGVVPVVLCKDCEHRTDKMYIGHYMCTRKMDGMVDPHDFCSYGERRREDDNP